MATSNGAGGHPVLKIVRFVEHHRKMASIRGINAVELCLAFKKSGPFDTPEAMVCSTCGRNLRFHCKPEQLPEGIELPTTEETTPLNRRAAAAAGAPLPPRPPQQRVAAATPPPTVLNNNAGSSEVSGVWRKVGDGNMPPKKRRVNMEKGEASGESSTSA